MAEQGLAHIVPLRPRLVAAARRRHVPPAQPGALIGRDALVEDLRHRLLRGNARLLTLTGPGGSGKTRLAVDVAAAVADRFDLGACFVDLSALRECELVVPAIARALRLQDGTERSVYEAISDQLGDQSVLLVLDNFEQVTDAAVRIAELLSACPRLTVVATSRATLRIRWEQEVPVPPLAVPDLAHLPSPAELARIPAVALFAERARAVRPDLVLDEAVGRDIAEICVRLDGLPLALELAAARVKLMSPAAVLTRLVRRIDVLGPASKDVPARQRTLGDAMDWSYDLLPAQEQVAFRRLAIFVGGFSLLAAEATLGLEGIPLLERVGSLVDKSLVRPLPVTDEPDAEPRFQMLETVRQYGVDRLAAGGEDALARERHAAFCLALAEAASPALHGASLVANLTRLENEHANMRAALASMLEGSGPALRLAGALWPFWEVRGYLAEGRQWLHRALEADDGSDLATRANALYGAGTLASRQADYATATEFLDQAVALYRRVADRAGEGLALQALGVQAQMQSDFARAATLHEEGLALLRAVGHDRGIAYSLNNIGYMLWRQGNPDAAATLHEESVAIARRLGEKRLAAVPLYNLGVIARFRHDLTEAAALFSEALVLFEELGDRRWIAFSLSDLGDIAEQEHAAARAIQLGQQALALFAEIGDKFGIALTCERLARVCATIGDRLELAVRLFSTADALRIAIKSPRPPGEEHEQEDRAHRARLESALGIASFKSIWTEARTAGTETVVRQALTMQPPSVSRTGSVATSVADHGPLSQREHQVALLIAQGLTNREISKKLVLSERTVEAHVDHIRQKLSVRGRAQIAAWVTGRGAVQIS